jgi:hypothetical protein
MQKKLSIEVEEASLGVSIDSAYEAFTALYNPSGEDPDESDISASKASVKPSLILSKGTSNVKPRISPYRSGCHCICPM